MRRFEAKTRVTMTAVALALVLLMATPGPAAPQHGDHRRSSPAAAGHDDHSHHAAPVEGRVEIKGLEGLSIPDVPVRDQDGRQVRFYSDLVAGKVVAMNFIFTTCTTICPPLGVNFSQLQKILGERSGEDVHLISVSVDPVTDRPERMKAWGKIFGAGPGWTLVTGDRAQVTKLLKALEVFTPDKKDHSPTVIMGNAASGTWTRAYGLAPPAKLAEIIDSLGDRDSGTGEVGE